jgi:hypothetical protein
VSLAALDRLADAPLITLFRKGRDEFTDIITPRQPVNVATGLVVLAHNDTDQTVWWADGLVECGTAGARPCSGECSIVPGRATFNADEVKLKLKNVGTATATIRFISLTWPDEHGNLKEVKLSGDRIFSGPVPPPSVEITAFEGPEKNRRIKAGDDEEIKFKFERKAHTSPT